MTLNLSILCPHNVYIHLNIVFIFVYLCLYLSFNIYIWLFSSYFIYYFVSLLAIIRPIYWRNMSIHGYF